MEIPDIASAADRLVLITELFDKVLDTVEFRTGDVGADLAFAMGAIAQNDIEEFEIGSEFSGVLIRGFPKPHRIWDFIKLHDPIGGAAEFDDED